MSLWCVEVPVNKLHQAVEKGSVCFSYGPDGRVESNTDGRRSYIWIRCVLSLCDREKFASIPIWCVHDRHKAGHPVSKVCGSSVTGPPATLTRVLGFARSLASPSTYASSFVGGVEANLASTLKERPILCARSDQINFSRARECLTRYPKSSTCTCIVIEICMYSN